MPYVAFDVCTVPVCGQQQRGAKATCGRCGTVNTVAVATYKNRGDATEELQERHVTRKFEAMGWKIGKHARQNRCPACFSAIKIAATRKSRENHMDSSSISSKVVPINPTPVANAPPIEHQRAQTRDDRRIIFEKIDDVYVDERIGYSTGWSDQRIATDLGVPRAWVSKIRDENFGADIDEAATAAMTAARAVLDEIRTIGSGAETIVRQLQELIVKADQIEATLKTMENRK
jgi:hypothetical protein